MPRNSSGIYTLPAGNPVVADTVIDVDWANPTMSDIGNELTLSLPRNGSAGMLGPLMLIQNAVAPLEAVPLQQLQGYLPLTGGTLTGDLVFNGSGLRIKGDFTNSISQLLFQTSTANAETFLGAIPNGTNKVAGFYFYNGTDIANTGYCGIEISETSARVVSGKGGTGTYLPFSIGVAGAERFRIETDGRIAAGATASATARMTIGAPQSSGLADILQLIDTTSGNSGFHKIFADPTYGSIYRIMASNVMDFYTGGVQRMRIAANGQVTIPADIVIGSTLSANQIEVGSTTAVLPAFIDFHADGLTTDYNARIIRSTGVNGSWEFSNAGTGALQFATNSAIRIKMDANGNVFFPTPTGAVLVGTETPLGTGDAGTNYGWSYVGSGAVRQNYAASAEGLQINASNYASGTTYMVVFRAGTASARGFISFDGTNVAFTNSSDYRLKKDITPIENALSKVAMIKPCTFAWKENDKRTSGFIAHELQQVIPEAVVGEKDAVDANGEMVIQGVDPAKLVTYLVAAIQELSAKVTSLEAQLASR